jgi:hypothetical protein
MIRVIGKALSKKSLGNRIYYREHAKDTRRPEELEESH